MTLMRQLVAILLLCVLSINAQADKFIVGAQNLEYFPHYDFTSKIDKGVGWAILEAFSEASGHEFIYVSMPIRRLQMEMLKGNVDFVYPDNQGWYNSITSAKEKYFSLPLTYALTGTIVDASNAGKGVDAIKNLAMPLGFTPVNWQSRIDEDKTKITWVQDLQQGLALLYQGRVDALDLEYFVAQYASVNTYPNRALVLDLTLPHNEIPFSLSSLSQKAVIQELNAFITSNPDLIDSIRHKYAITPYSQLLNQLIEQQGLKHEEVWK